jgi:hypothetical protein
MSFIGLVNFNGFNQPLSFYKAHIEPFLIQAADKYHHQIAQSKIQALCLIDYIKFAQKTLFQEEVLLSEYSHPSSVTLIMKVCVQHWLDDHLDAFKSAFVAWIQTRMDASNFILSKD